MSMDCIAKEWLAARKIIADTASEAGIKMDATRFAEAVIARLASNKPPILLEMDDGRRGVLNEWLEGEFREAVKNDRKRILESLWMVKVGIEKGEDHYEVMSAAIASFVAGLILGEQPVTVPTENN